MDKKKRGCYKADGLGPGAKAPSRGSYRAYGRHIYQEIQMPKAGGSL